MGHEHPSMPYTPGSHMDSVDFSAFYPNNNENKKVFCHAALHKADFPTPETDRHVLLWWNNGQLHGQPITQVIQLRGVPGMYTVDLPTKIRSANTMDRNDVTSLGAFTRAQRNSILQLAQN